jgi:hypothetical protein
MERIRKLKGVLNMISKDMNDFEGTAIAELTPLLGELGFLAGYDKGDEMKPLFKFNDDGFTILLDGPSGTIHVVVLSKGNSINK